MASERYGMITNIQRYTIHDGPGIRTEIFFKGCNMRCPWCSNPETQSVPPELAIYPTKCLGEAACGLCAGACPEENLIQFRQGVLLSAGRQTQCAGCLACAGACPAGAIQIWGRRMTVEQLMQIIRKDLRYYRRSGGGVTLNGGEVLLQWEFAAELLAACRAEGISTCVESALNCPRAHVEAVLPYTDYVITDIKHMDDEVHRSLTGLGNRQILENIRYLAESGTGLVIRTPVVPGRNGSEAAIRAIAAFIRDRLGGRVIQYQLLPYRKMGTEKYASLERLYPMEGERVQPREEWEPKLLRLAALAREEYGLPAVAGSSQEWV